MKNIYLIFLILLLSNCETPYKIVETTTIDTVSGKHIITKTKYFNQNSTQNPSIQVISTPTFGYYYPFGYPHYNIPRIILPYRYGHGHRH